MYLFTDVDECEVNTICSIPNQECFNTDGSFVCVCNEGTLLINGSCQGNKYSM